MRKIPRGSSFSFDVPIMCRSSLACNTDFYFYVLGTNAFQEKTKPTEDQSLGFSGSGSVVDRMDRIGGFGGGMRCVGMMESGGVT